MVMAHNVKVYDVRRMAHEGEAPKRKPLVPVAQLLYAQLIFIIEN